MAWSRESSTSRGYGYAWQKIRRQALRRDMHLCQPCASSGKLTIATEVDHITPKAKCGEDSLDNLQSICTDCHKAKTAEDEGRAYRPKPIIGPNGWPIG